MAGLAGSVLVCCSSADCAATTLDAGQIPSQERQLLTAIQAAFPEDGDQGRPLVLRLAQAMDSPPLNGAEPNWNDAPDETLQLRAAPLPALPVTESPASAALPVQAPGPQLGSGLRLSQTTGVPNAAAKSPRWMTPPPDMTQLRPSRTLSMPGAAGPGRIPVQGVSKLPLAGEPAAEVAAPLDDDGDDTAVGARSASSPALATNLEEPAEDTGLAGSGWEIPPIRWGGSVGYSIQKNTSDSGSSTSAQGMFANLSASSYVYAPWFATVSGRLGITNSSSSSTTDAAGGGASSSSANIVGGGEINALSSTRFPFRAYFDRSDSRANGSIVALDYVNTRFGLTQNFRSEDSFSSGNFMLDRSSVETSDGNKDSVTALSGSYSTQTGLWQHNANARYSLGERDATGEKAILSGFNTSHNANLSDTANLSATVNYSDTDLRTKDPAGGFFTNRGRFLQVYTYGSWMPEFEELEDLPLTLNGSVRYSSQETTFGSSRSTSQTLGGNLSGLYRFSNNLSGSINTALNHISVSQGPTHLLALVGSNLNYVGNPLTFGNFSYNWNVGGNANWQSGVGEVGASSQLGALASHSLARVYTMGNGQTLSLSYSQSLSATSTQSIGNSESLSNNLSLNYGMYAGERFTGALSGTLSDVYTTGVNSQHYTNLNLGLVGQGQLSQQSSLNMNLMLNWSDQTTETLDAFGVPQAANSQRMSLNGSLNYNHQRFAGVRGLRYDLLFAADTRLRDDRLYGNINANADQDRSRLSLTNRLDYSIGLLNFRLSLINNEVGGKKNALLFFQVTRQIGAY